LGVESLRVRQRFTLSKPSFRGQPITVRTGLGTALITSTCIAVNRQQWNPELRDRVLAVIFDGLRRR